MLNNKNTIEIESWREKVVSCALAYANHIWKPTDKNCFHGYDANNIQVNTPNYTYISSKYNCGWWIPNQLNKGIPYNWGGSATIKEFDNGIKDGKYAGNVPDSRDYESSTYCVGVDCSGLVTNCWNLGQRVVTKTIENISYLLDSMELLLPGDIILLPGSHVMIFIEYTKADKTLAQIVDASRSTGRVCLRIVDLTHLTNEGYKGFRKNI